MAKKLDPALLMARLDLANLLARTNRMPAAKKELEEVLDPGHHVFRAKARKGRDSGGGQEGVLGQRRGFGHGSILLGALIG